jgi:D-alanyl-D-alanine carboxypeptidase
MMQSARRAFLAIGLTVAALPLMFSAAAQAQTPYSQLVSDQPRYAAIVLDAKTGETLYEKRADSARYPASITKIMTLYLTFEALSEGRLHTSDYISVSSHAAAQAPTKLGLRAGDSIMVDDAMRAITTKSANDMAVALAERLGGSESRFAALMTVRAQELGMSNTRFVNASGLPDSRQLSSARDIAILSRAVMRDFPQYYSYFNIRSFTYRGVTMNNHNGLLGRMPGVDGLKTGYTSASGFNLAASSVQNGRRLIVVVMGGPTSALRDAKVRDLLLTGFDVEERRAKGERIMVADNLFERGPARPAPTQYAQASTRGVPYSTLSPYGRASASDQPDAPYQAPSEIRLTSYAPPAPAASSRMAPISDPPALTTMRTYASMDAARQAAPTATVRASYIAKPAPKPAALAQPKGQWAVQVGAFRGRSQARAQVDLIDRRFGDLFAQAEGLVEDAVQGQYRARFNGMTADEAQEACHKLAAKRQACMVIAPAR